MTKTTFALDDEVEVSRPLHLGSHQKLASRTITWGACLGGQNGLTSLLVSHA